MKSPQMGPELRGFYEWQSALLEDMLRVDPLLLRLTPMAESVLITDCCRSMRFTSCLEEGDHCYACSGQTFIREATHDELHLVERGKWEPPHNDQT